MSNADQWLLDTEQQIAPLIRWQKSINLTTRMFQAPSGVILQHRQQGYQVASAAEHPANPFSEGALVSRATEAFNRAVLEVDAPLYFANPSQQPDWLKATAQSKPSFCSWLGTPIHWPDGKPFGTLCIMDFAPTHYDDTLLELLAQQRDSIQTDLLLIQQYDQIRQLAACDDQTGLTNLHGFLAQAEQRLRLAQQQRAAQGLIYLQLNGLSMLRERLSQQSATLALNAVAETLRSHIRDNDLAARVDDNAFAIMTSLRDPATLARIGNRIVASLPELLTPPLGAYCQLVYGCVLISNLNQPLDHWLAQAHSHANREAPRPLTASG